MRRPPLVALLIAAAISLALAVSTAAAAPASPDEVALARTYAPVVKLKEKPGSCDIGQPYQPIDVDLLLGNHEVALRGPWDGANLVKVGPVAGDLPGRFDYNLDFPGNALRPGCIYEQWQSRLLPEAPSTTYARVVTEEGHPGKIALQYWFFYVYNDWNNKHEGDWEMIQLVWDAATPGEALTRPPVEVGYSQHSSAERASWDDPKLEKVDGTHPVVYPAQGSQANFFGSNLYLMRSSAEGVGCDDTTGPSKTVTPRVVVVPTAASDYLPLFPWLGYDGRWGERQASFFNGPTGPNAKEQWTRPFTWERDFWRDESFAFTPGSSPLPAATDFFCGAVAAGSEVLRRAKDNPAPWLLGLLGIVVILIWALSRTTFRPSTPLRVPRRRTWGQLVTASGRMYASRPRLFLGIGLLFIPIGVLVVVVQGLLFRVVALAPLVDEAGRRNAFVAALAFGVGLVFTLFGLAVVQAATVRALVEIDEGRRVTALGAYRSLRGRLRHLAVALLVILVAQIVLNLTVVLVPVAIFLLVRWSLVGAVAGLEDRTGIGVLRRSAVLTRRRWWRTATFALGLTGLALLIGPIVGALALFATAAAFDVVNLISALIYVAALPFVAILMSYLYFDLRIRAEAAASAPAEESAPSELATAAGS